MMVWILLMLGCGATGEAPFQRGLSAIRAGDTASALSGFEQALADGGRHPAVYHGLGNVLYRLGHHGEAVAAWRRGLALDPRNGDIAANLDHVRATFQDRITPPPQHRAAFFWQSFLSPLESALLGAMGMGMGMWMAVWGRIRRLRGRGGLGGNARLFGGGAALVGLLVGVSAIDTLNHRKGAVVTVDELDVRSALGPSGVSLFVLHEGAEVGIAGATDTHTLLVLSGGRKGWVNTNALRSTNPAHPFVFKDE